MYINLTNMEGDRLIQWRMPKTAFVLHIVEASRLHVFQDPI